MPAKISKHYILLIYNTKTGQISNNLLIAYIEILLIYQPGKTIYVENSKFAENTMNMGWGKHQFMHEILQ